MRSPLRSPSSCLTSLPVPRLSSHLPRHQPQSQGLWHTNKSIFSSNSQDPNNFSVLKNKKVSEKTKREKFQKKIVTVIVWVFMKVSGCTSCTAFQMYWQKGRRPRTREGLVAGVPCVSDLPVLLPGKKGSLTLASKGFAGLPVRRP